MRNNSYDFIKQTTALLNKQLEKKSELKNKIQKSESSDLFFEEELEENQTKIDKLAKLINQQFRDLMSDYKNGKIPMSMTKDILKSLHDFLTNRTEKIDDVEIPIEINPMVLELDKLGFN